LLFLPMRRVLLRGLLGISLSALLLLAVVGWIFSSVVTQPNRMKGHEQSYAARLLPRQEAARATGGGVFSLKTRDGVTLSGIHFRHKPANDRFIVLVHGFGGSILDYDKQPLMWLDLGYDVFVYDQRDSGLSGGSHISCGVFESRDLADVVVFARTQVAPGALAGVVGCSMGGAVVLLYAGQGGPCDFVVADCPYTSFYEEALYRLEKDYRFLPRFLAPAIGASADFMIRLRAGFSLRDAAPIGCVDRIHCPVLFFNTAEDRFIPTRMTQLLFDKATAPKRLRVFPKGGHSAAFVRYPSEYRAELASFLADDVCRLH
jgi:pimeloyl-ACP methyl ester carboxylesterase